MSCLKKGSPRPFGNHVGAAGWTASVLIQTSIDVNGTLVGTDAECKEGVDIADDGTWGCHPLLVSLANTKEPLYLVNRSGPARPSC